MQIDYCITEINSGPCSGAIFVTVFVTVSMYFNGMSQNSSWGGSNITNFQYRPFQSHIIIYKTSSHQLEYYKIKKAYLYT